MFIYIGAATKRFFTYPFFSGNCSGAVADIVFIMDESGSVRYSNFQTMKSFVYDLVNSFPIGQNEVMEFSLSVCLSVCLFVNLSVCLLVCQCVKYYSLNCWQMKIPYSGHCINYTATFKRKDRCILIHILARIISPLYRIRIMSLNFANK